MIGFAKKCSTHKFMLQCAEHCHWFVLYCLLMTMPSGEMRLLIIMPQMHCNQVGRTPALSLENTTM